MKPKVLLFIDWFLPGYKAGGPVTSNSNMIEHLRQEVDFYVLTRNTDYCEQVPYSTVPSNQWVKEKEGVSVFYFSDEFLTTKNLKRVAREAGCSQWYINGIYSLYFSILPLLFIRFNKNIKATVSARGMLSPHALAVKGWKKKRLLWLFRSLGFYRKVRFHATNANEAIEISKQVGRNAGIRVAANLSKPVTPEQTIKPAKVSGVLKLIGLARISPEKNTLGALELLLQCTQHTIQLDWYGQPYDQDYVKACETMVRQLPGNVQVTFHGSISPIAIPEVMKDAHFLFHPTKGENFGHSILESLMAGCPVLISDQTPWRDLEEKGIGWDIALDQPEQFIGAIESAAAMDQESYLRMSRAACDFARTFTNDPKVLEANRTLFKN